MKIILVTPLLDHGGAQRYITNIANYWASLGHVVTVLVMRSGTPFFMLSERVTVIELNYSNRNTINRVFTGLRASIRLRGIIKREKPSFVLSTLSSTNVFTLLSTGFLKVSVFVRDSMSPYRKRRKIETRLRKLLYKKAAGIIVMTERAKKFVINEVGADNIRVIPNPVQQYLSKVTIEKEKIVINVGRLTEVKGQLYFIEACAKINRPDWKFVILGEGDYRNKLEAKRKELNLEENIILTGAVKDVNHWLYKSMIFVSTSISEGWANSICEAMAVGLPVVSFNCDVSPEEMIDHNKNGFLVPVRDVDELSKQIEKLMDDTELRDKIGQNATLKMKEFKIDLISKQILEFCSA